MCEFLFSKFIIIWAPRVYDQQVKGQYELLPFTVGWNCIPVSSVCGLAYAKSRLVQLSSFLDRHDFTRAFV